MLQLYTKVRCFGKGKEGYMEYQLLLGDCLTVLKTLPSNSVQCCITSPPY